jgi:hypothetical protein
MNFHNRLAAISIAAMTAATLLFSGAPAHALTVGPGGTTVALTSADVGQSFSINWLQPLSGPDATAKSTWTVESFSPTKLTLGISLTNTTAASFPASITTFGFGVTPNATGAFAAGGKGTVFNKIGAGNGPNQTFPGGFKGIDVCLFGQNCAGGAFFNGLLNHATDAVTVALSGVFGTNPVTLGLIPLKFQTDIGSFEVAGTVSPVPLPAALPLLATALAGLGLWGRRSRRRGLYPSACEAGRESLTFS